MKGTKMKQASVEQLMSVNETELAGYYFYLVRKGINTPEQLSEISRILVAVEKRGLLDSFNAALSYFIKWA